MMLKKLLLVILIVASRSAFAQDARYVLALEKKIAAAENDAAKISGLGELAAYYSLFNQPGKADTTVQRALLIAELGEDKSVITRMLVDNNVSNLSNLSDAKIFDKAIAVIEKGISFAQEKHDDRLEALGYIKLAGIYRKKHRFDDAMQNTSKATTALSGTSERDTLHVELFCEMGKIYAEKADPVPAVKNYNKAFDIAYRLKNVRYQSKVYHLFAELYFSFNQKDHAKKNLLESLQLNRHSNNADGIFLDYFDLGRVTDEKTFIDLAVQQASRMNSPVNSFRGRLLLYYWYMTVGKKSDETFNYLNANPDIIQFFNNISPSSLCWQRGYIYKFSGQYNSALDCFHTSEKDAIAQNNPAQMLEVYKTLGETYLLNHDTAHGAEYYEKTYHVADSLHELSDLNLASANLAELFAVRNNFQKAYQYRLRADSIRGILTARDEKDKLVILAMERESSKGDFDRIEAEHERERKHGIQITAITILIALSFFGMLFLGMFEVSKTVIRLVGYFVFISLFEFIVLMLEHPLMAITHGEPLRLWLFKIAIIAILVPIQHFLEKHTVTFLESRTLLTARQKLSQLTFWRKKQIVESSDDATIQN